MISVRSNNDPGQKNIEPASSDPIVKRLAEIQRAAPELEDMVTTYGVILPLLRDVDLHVIHVFLTQEQARNKLQAGIPLLQDTDIEFDIQAVADLFVALVNKLGSNGGRVAAPSIQVALKKGSLDAYNIVSLAAAGEKDKIMNAATAQTLDPEFLWTLAQFALKPAYYAVRRQIEHFVEQTGWDNGFCPVCGAQAVLGELRDNNLAKYLRCSRCGASWRSSRLQCHLCENDDHRTLGILYNDDKPDTVRLEVCYKCKGYIKVITTFSPIAPEIIAIEDLATLSLDYAAQKSGYISRSHLAS